MASDNPNAAGGSSRRTRTPPTLDLKAEEMRAEPGTEAATPAQAAGETAAEALGEAAAEGRAPSAPGTESRAPGAEAPADVAPAMGEASPAGTPEGAPSEAASAPGPAAPEVPSPDARSPDARSLDAPRAEAPRRGGAGTVVAALVLGALAGGAAGGGVFYYLAQNAPRPPAVDLSPLAARIAVLEARPVADGAALAALRQGLSQADARVSALDKAVSGLKAAPAAAAPAAPNVDALKAALGKTDGAVSDVAARVAALKTSQDGLKSVQDALQSAVAAAASAAQQAQTQAQVLGPRLDGLGSHIDAVRKEAADAASAAAAINRGAASVLVLGTLKQSVDAGRPFASELDAARALLGPRAAALEPFAGKAQAGFPPLPQLADQLARTGGAAIESLAPAPEAPAADASLMTRFLASAQSLVKVRPADGVDPESLRGLLDRAVAAVRLGDIAGALAALRQLPPPVQEKLAAVTAELDARRRAAEAATTLYQQALAAISGKTP
ncbi:hypothetical protein V5F38_10495 [Xanthobacter sp. V0B-10]|uniref:hypothetical protein n=1 Tax=Xanthobacter albus TaxID=3119929 RepID=UPI003729CB50